MRKLSWNGGFSLIELMVVMLIIGLGYGAVRMLAPNDTEADEAQNVAAGFQFWFEKQMDHALITGSEVGFYVTENAWYPLSWREGIEQEAEPDIVWALSESQKPFTLDERMRFEVIVDDLGNRWLELGRELPESSVIEPHVILLPSEEYFPAFEVKIQSRNTLEERYEFSIVGNGFNRLVVVAND